jgi:molecular chaperone HtpG
VRNIFDGLSGLKNTQAEVYAKFYADFGPLLKEGLGRDWENRDKIANLLMFASAFTPPGQTTTFKEYVEKMPQDQEHIYYLIGDNVDQLRNSPYLEAFRAKGHDVLLLSDSIDEFAIPQYTEYQGKKLQAADRGELKDADSGVSEDAKAQFANLLAHMKTLLPEVSEVRLTKRLTDSAACLVADAGAMTAHMERLLRRYGEETAGGPKRVLELNPENPAVQALRTLHVTAPTDPRIEGFSRLLYDQAVIAEGSRIADPVAFAKRINELITQQAGSR